MRRFCLIFVCIWLLPTGFASAQTNAQGVQFCPTLLTVDANEGIDIADVNNDGSLDIVAGRNWFAAPDFKPRPLRSIDDWNGYVQSNGEHLYDVDNDGWIDVVAGSFLPSEIYWYQNPGKEGLKQGKLWKKQLLVDTKFSQNEMCFLRDFDGDGKPEWIFNSWKKQNPVIAWSFQKTNKQPASFVLKPHVIGDQTHGHGMGFGDVNQDGREDVLVSTGWYERPENDPLSGKPWKFHADWSLPHASCPMLVRDINGDGNNDIVWGHGHNYGVYWWEYQGTQEGKLNYQQHVIDDRYSQAHAIHFADIDGDGADELITGKRVRAHNGKDPGGKERPCMYYYKWDASAQSFHRFVIDEGHIGIGLQIRTADIDGDGDIDIAVAGKDGTWLLRNQSKSK